MNSFYPHAQFIKPISRQLPARIRIARTIWAIIGVLFVASLLVDLLKGM